MGLGLYLLLTAVVSFGLGGYAVGRLRARSASDTTREAVEFRDGINGALAWAVAVVVTGLVAAATAASIADSSVHISAALTASTGDNLIALDVDRLFRGDRRPVEGDITYARAEANRILLTASGHQGVQPNDRDYLVR